MVNFSSVLSAALVRTLLAMLFLTLHLPAAAQAPAWQSAQAVGVATAAVATNYAAVSATAVDAVGNVLLAGSFSNTIRLGSTTLTSLGNQDVFVAKFNPATNQFLWAQRAGGTGADYASALAVSGTNIYVAGSFASTTAGFGAVSLTNVSTVAGGYDVFVAKLTDMGGAGSFAWAQSGGGTGQDYASALAVSGTSVYMAGYFDSRPINFGATSLPNLGSYNVFITKLTDAGSAGSFVWAKRAGSAAGGSVIAALAVNGTSVYMAGGFDYQIYFDGISLFGGGNPNVFVAKLTDAGNTGSFVWAQRAGGNGAAALAVSGNSIYVAGTLITNNPPADFGTTVLTTAGLNDIFVAKIADAGNTGSFVWAQRGGGTGYETARAVAVSGANVYVAGSFNSATAGFGATTLTNAGSGDAFVAKLTDAGNMGSFAWAQRAGGAGGDEASSLVLSGNSVYVAGSFASSTADFGPTTLTNPNAGTTLGFLASLTDPTLTATAPGRALAQAHLFPNPARHAVTLRLPAGTAPAPLTLTDALGRPVRRYPAPAGPEATLDLHGLPASLYLLRGAGPAQRLAVE